MGFFGVILLPMMLLLSSTVTGHEYVDFTDLDHHPMILAAEESTADCPADIDPNAHWMKKFLLMIKDKMPHEASTWEELLPNLRHLADLETKGWLAAIAKGEKKPEDVTWPDPTRIPWIIPTYMPVVTPDQPEPVIIVEQTYDGKKVFKEIIGHTTRKKRDANGNEYEEIERQKRRAFHVDPKHMSENLPYIGEKPDHDIHEPEFDDDGQIIGRKKRDTPPNLTVWPAPGTLFTVKRLCVKAHANGTIIFPDE